MTLSLSKLSTPRRALIHEVIQEAVQEAVRPARAAVRLTIEYCEIGNYLKAARRLTAQIVEELRDCTLDFELVPSRGGVFEVAVDGRLVYSKRATHRLPDWDEISYHVNAARVAALE